MALERMDTYPSARMRAVPASKDKEGGASSGKQQQDSFTQEQNSDCDDLPEREFPRHPSMKCCRTPQCPHGRDTGCRSVDSPRSDLREIEGSTELRTPDWSNGSHILMTEGKRQTQKDKVRMMKYATGKEKGR